MTEGESVISAYATQTVMDVAEKVRFHEHEFHELVALARGFGKKFQRWSNQFLATKPFFKLHQSSVNSFKNSLILNVYSGVLKILSSNAPITDLLLLVVGLKSTSVCQALAKAGAVCLTESQDSCSTTSSEIEQHLNRDATVKSIFGIEIHEKLC